MDLDVQMNGGQTASKAHLSRATFAMSKHITTLRRNQLAHITHSKQPHLGLAAQLKLITLIPLIPSALLVGNCLTVARVGIIIISLDHGIICFRLIISHQANQDLIV